MNEKKWSIKKILLWGAVLLIAVNSFWTVMQTKMTATAGESDGRFSALSARVQELEKGSVDELENRITTLEKKIEELVSGLESRAKVEEARKKALYDQIKALEHELKHLEEK